MKWLIHLENYNISFNTSFLKKEDYILTRKYIDHYKIIYIVNGFMQANQVFTNGEIICHKLLYKSNAFINIEPYIYSKNQTDINYYYNIKALTDTTIIIIDPKEFIQKLKNNTELLYTIIYLHHDKNQDIVRILSHKGTKKRLVQFLLIMIENFGRLTEQKIIIPFNLSHYNIGTIIGSQRITVNKIMNNLKKNNVINYNEKEMIILNLTKLIQL